MEEISKEKATEFDLLMKPKSKKNAVLWIASIAAAIIIAFLLFSNRNCLAILMILWVFLILKADSQSCFLCLQPKEC